MIVAVPTGIISFIISILLLLGVTDILWLWGVVAAIISIPLIFNALQTKGIEVKETAIYLKKGFGWKRKILISKLNQIDFIYYKSFDYKNNTENVKLDRNDIIESDLIISTAPTIRIKGFIFPLNLALSEYDFNKNREKFIEFFSKISYILPVNLATNDEQLIKEFKEKVNNAVIKKDLVGLRYVYGKYYKKIYLG
ncbi:MAG: hypothetical protein COZ18_15530 [Flexibacter sp. CG_4_10_14_3_um_filter_32_15]|nr:MAG: hypothetical protein COZ18_15530 [Flexibacter sp. CG_4_10_14_3_um_filter_32_15]